MLRQPVVNAALLSRELGIAQPNVYRTRDPLEAAQVLAPSGGSSGRVWRSPEVLDALDAFAERAGSRRRSTAQECEAAPDQARGARPSGCGQTAAGWGGAGWCEAGSARPAAVTQLMLLVRPSQ